MAKKNTYYNFYKYIICLINYSKVVSSFHYSWGEIRMFFFGYFFLTGGKVDVGSKFYLFLIVITYVYVGGNGNVRLKSKFWKLEFSN